jgi:DNA-binding NarL/FixJ family response regulator
VDSFVVDSFVVDSFMDEKIRVLLVEDEAIVSEAICALLALEAKVAVVGQAATGEEAVQQARLLSPDVILLDLHLPDQSGISVIQEVLKHEPDARILILTAYLDHDDVAAALKAGAAGYMLKTQSIAELVQAIANVYQGQPFLHPKAAYIMLRELYHMGGQAEAEHQLSESEKQILVYLAQGLSNKEIAARLGVTTTTIRAHVSSILRKLHLSNRTQVALYALKQGLATLEVKSRHLGL